MVVAADSGSSSGAIFSRVALDCAGWIPTGPKAKAAALALSAVLLWSTWPMLATYASPAPPLLVFGLAAAIGFFVLLSRAAVTGGLRGFVSIRLSTLLFVAVGLFANNILYLLAMPRIGPAEANVIAYTWPVMLVGFGAVVGRSRIGLIQAFGILAAFAGAALVIGPRLGSGIDMTGVTLAFLSGLVFAIYALVRSFGREAHDVIGLSMGLIAVVSLTAHAAVEPSTALAPSQWLAIAGIGIAPLSVSNMLWDRAGKTGQLPLIASIAYLTPLCALLLLALTGAAAVGLATGLGAILTVFGAIAAARTTPHEGSKR